MAAPAIAPQSISADTLLEVVPVPFTGKWVVRLGGEAVEIAGVSLFDNEASAKAAAETLRTN
jgi:hypothetical protein